MAPEIIVANKTTSNSLVGSNSLNFMCAYRQMCLIINNTKAIWQSSETIATIMDEWAILITIISANTINIAVIKCSLAYSLVLPTAIIIGANGNIKNRLEKFLI